MKNLILFILISGFFQFSYAQSESVIDGAYKKNIRDSGDDRKIQGYQHVREADVMWSTKITRVINLTEKINQVFYYPTYPINDRKNLVTVLLDAIKEGTITAYDPQGTRDDEFKVPMTMSTLDVNLGNINVEQSFLDEESDEYVTIIDSSKFDSRSVKKYRVKEEWYFDKQRSVMDVRIIGLCPMMELYDDNNVYKGADRYLFWVYFPEARNVLSKAEVFNHRKNDAARLTYDDIFHKRFFNSYIVKESNKYDRSINEYRQGIDALLEAEAIQEEIFNLEHDLWEY
jgi:gliding motility associated protien GldN